MTACQSELLQLKNLGMASVNILRAIGINTHADLKRLGAVEAYRRIRARNINVSKVMLYALEGALMDIHWNDIPPDLKARLVQQAEQPDDLISATA
ncbi:competence protein TfoX [Cellvibrio mixtus]|jgi:DNA transformation protein|uniref:Competence protein TfoX n=1 Tax=Cellvibrio mixtus TaxID=39650 RepID=A0A266QDB1_9GAMM|nr:MULTISPECIES: TfoX/Sxy family protein [Cellvibrio]AQT61622.1 competence protein TfoX [Cellvibrio sp. PSBB023]OZY87874.1 competence protein TfoX [Cellvibrio mixtus]